MSSIFYIIFFFDLDDGPDLIKFEVIWISRNAGIKLCCTYMKQIFQANFAESRSTRLYYK
jgi:hypothetical protein